MLLGCLGDFLCYFEPMFDNFSTRARQLVFAARFKAGERGAAVIDTDDLLVGLVLEDQGLLLKSLFPDAKGNAFVETVVEKGHVVGRFRKASAHVPFFSQELAEDLLTKLKESIPRSQPVPETTEIPLSSSLKRVFDLAKELQPQFRHSHMEPLHLLAAILKEDSSEGAKLLRRSGVTLENVCRNSTEPARIKQSKFFGG